MRVLEDVVAENDDERLAAREVLGHADHLRDPAGTGLHLVGEVELEQRRVAAASGEMAVAEQVDHLPGVPLAGDHEHLADARELEQLERVVDHRPASHRQQVLVRDPRQLPEPCRFSSRADQSLHDADANRDQAAWDMLGAGSASGLRSSSPERQLDGRADPEGEYERAEADRAAERKPDRP